ncbi:hypothetical protein Anas_03795 [Armadillidium nasatum]|uniref:Uncharacterized protein n=1 Tax=Armadillidium nasatum TaxID=96803 RepID=A0A5N5TNJ8_9CRUS|nr:hypothetical protein Anas_03795 [Armadillidium nasatum]
MVMSHMKIWVLIHRGTRWLPILEKVGAALPLDCPLHPARDIFTLQESKKRHDSPQWTCGFCGKSFYHETHLDGEDTICLADFCDVMRCEVLQERLRELEEVTPSTTALDVWHKPILLTSSLRSSHSDQAVEMALPRSLIRSSSSNTWQRKSSPSPPSSSSGKYSHPSKSSIGSPSSKSHFSHHKRRAKEEEEPGEIKIYEEKHYRCEVGDRSCKENDQHNDSEPSSEGPTERPIHPLHSWKDTCNEEQLAEIRVKCQITKLPSQKQLIQQCVSGLVLNLTFEQVKDVEDFILQNISEVIEEYQNMY